MKDSNTVYEFTFKFNIKGITNERVIYSKSFKDAFSRYNFSIKRFNTKVNTDAVIRKPLGLSLVG